MPATEFTKVNVVPQPKLRAWSDLLHVASIADNAKSDTFLEIRPHDQHDFTPPYQA